MRDTIMSVLATLTVKRSDIIFHSCALGNAISMNYAGVKRGGGIWDLWERKYNPRNKIK